MTDISWLFFDVGSTLLDESKVYEGRFRMVAEKAGVPYEEVYDKALEFYRLNKKGDNEVMKLYGTERPEWRSEDEIPYPDAAECLRHLKQRYNIGIIANQNYGTAARLEGHGLMKYIDLVVASAEEGVAKPDRRIFDIALERPGCKPCSAVMIGDRIDNDILPAKKLGMRIIWIKQGFGRYWQINDDSEIPDAEAGSLTELARMLMR